MKNDNGDLISGIRQLRKPEYGLGTTDRYGQPVVNWAYLSEYADEEAFDTRAKQQNGSYKIRVRLPYGVLLIRYGNETGHFTAPYGTKYDRLALPYKKESIEYNEYRVIANNIEVVCMVDMGIVAPGFDSPGGAVQYFHPITIRESIKRGFLKML